MSNKVGTMNSALVWAFALGAVVLGVLGAYATAGLGTKVSSGVFFGAFLVTGFLATLLTQARTWVAVLAFVAASALSAGTYYVVAAGALAGEGGDGAGVLGAFIGIFVAAIALVVSLVGGVSGCVAGAKARTTMQQAAK